MAVNLKLFTPEDAAQTVSLRGISEPVKVYRVLTEKK